MEWHVQPQSFLGLWMTPIGPKVLVTWDKLLDHKSSWELAHNLTNKSPKFHLEDQANLKEGSNDMILLLTSKRHKKEAHVQHMSGTISTTREDRN
ncbi:unnamed protein product [Spirodela intermedia]|uniref:Uncharacterized protein n=2 Tax=Spirodela intermedia TaxID=51605 RepID=A0A7I8K7H5_SPIIN|nr:unnamed protein product [Spirodela intermedia]CAA6657015.1 unnamed protein product [Spirodela intermedia]CAA7393001.1 unnamed protein product [Spirodela intermedia]